jgi:hypothetical protein
MLLVNGRDDVQNSIQDIYVSLDHGHPKTARVFDGGHMGVGPVGPTIGAWLDAHMASARDPGGRGIWMKASTFGFDEITAEHVVLVSFDGDVLVGEHPRHLEWPIHTEVVRARPEVASVCTRVRRTRSPWGPAASRCSPSHTRRRCSCRPTCPATRAPRS